MKTPILILLSMPTVAIVAGCADSATCDPGEVLYLGQCMPIPASGPTDDAGVGEDAAEAEPTNALDGGTDGDDSDGH
jgi:hypothetical protein